MKCIKPRTDGNKETTGQIVTFIAGITRWRRRTAAIGAAALRLFVAAASYL